MFRIVSGFPSLATAHKKLFPLEYFCIFRLKNFLGVLFSM